MDASKLPTDSLYKMLAIGGLALLIAGFALVWPSTTMEENSFNEYSLSSNEFKLAAQGIYLTDQELIQALQEISKEWDNETPRIIRSLLKRLEEIPCDVESVDQTNAAEFRIKAAEYLQSLEIRRLLLGQVVDILNELDCPSEYKYTLGRLDKLHESRLNVLISSYAAFRSNDTSDMTNVRQAFIQMRAGIPLVFLGFYVFSRAMRNWYTQAQQYQDAILKSEAEEKVANNQGFDANFRIAIEIVYLCVVGFAGVIIAILMQKLNVL